MKSAIQSVEASCLVHATEDRERVARAISRALGTGEAAEVETMEGHFGNEIAMVKFRLAGEEAESAARSMFAKMPSNMKRELRRDLGAHLDEHSALYLRFDKQELVRGRLAAGAGDPVRVRVKPRLFLLKGRAQEFYLRFMEGGRVV